MSLTTIFRRISFMRYIQAMLIVVLIVVLLPWLVQYVIGVRRANATVRASYELNRLQSVLIDYALVNGELPGNEISDAMNLINDETYRDWFDPPAIPRLLEGKDFWGNPLRYEVFGKKEFRIYSIGGNGIDEDGGGDDILRTHEFNPTETETEEDRTRFIMREDLGVTTGGSRLALKPHELRHVFF